MYGKRIEGHEMWWRDTKTRMRWREIKGQYPPKVLASEKVEFGNKIY